MKTALELAGAEAIIWLWFPTPILSILVFYYWLPNGVKWVWMTYWLPFGAVEVQGAVPRAAAREDVVLS